MDRLARYAPQMLGITRIVTALVFMEHGTQKLFRFPPMGQFGGSPRAGGQAAQAAANTASSAMETVSSAVSSALDTASSMLSSAPPAPGPGGGPGGSMGTLFLVAGILETFGGLALVLGLLTRPIAFLLAGETAVIFWWMHVMGMGRGNIFPISNGGEGAALYCFTFLYLVFAGPGAFAVDGLFRRSRTV